jgi:hypothetical protein
MKTCLRYGMLGLLAAALLSQAQDPHSPAPRKPPAPGAPAKLKSPPPSARKTPPARPPAGSVVVGEMGGPAPLKMLEGIPIERAPSLPGRADRLIPPSAALQYRLDRSRYGGVIGEALLLDHPWELFNPLAPGALGDGTRNLRVNPFTGEGEGVILFSIRLPDHGAAKSVARQAKKKAAARAAATAPPATPQP